MSTQEAPVDIKQDNTKTSVAVSTPTEAQKPVTTTPPPEYGNDKPLIPPVYIAISVAAILLGAIVGIIVMIYLAANYAATIAGVRDILIIALALESCIFGIVILLLLIMVIRLVNMLEFEIKPILEQTNETIGMVRGTSTFMSENVVKPVTKANSYAIATARALRTLFGKPQ